MGDIECAATLGERLSGLNELSQQIAASATLEALGDLLTDRLPLVLGCETVSIYDWELLALSRTDGVSPPQARERELVGRAFTDSLVTSAIDEELVCRAQPVIAADRVLLVMYIEWAGFGTDQGEALPLLDNVLLHTTAVVEKLAARRALFMSHQSIVDALSQAMEASDGYTADHSQDVAKWALDVGRRMGLSALDLRDLELGALFHDIGKIAIPSEILNKPGKLTAEEFELMKTHTIEGEKIIAPIEFLTRVRPIVRHEHERWDGRGYPDGLAGEDIPLGSRIIFVCDAYHAITSTRPYREAQSHDVARRVLVENAGSQFDPVVVEVFLQVIEDHQALRQTAADDADGPADDVERAAA